MLIHDPSRFPAGTIVDEGAEGVDLMPTIMDAIGQPFPDATQGEPMQASAQGLGRGWPSPGAIEMTAARTSPVTTSNSWRSLTAA